MTPNLLYTYCPFFAGIFLWDTKQKHFALSLLPATVHENWSVKLLAAALEFWLVLFWVVSGHFGSYHSITFVRTIHVSI